jgi:DNA uptake protein ComE-like DNA-binding protein
MHQVKEQYAFHPTNPVFRIDLNIADTSDLSRLPGAGPVLSERIIRYRSALGGFFSPAQLTEVYGISDSLYNCIGNYLLADTMNIQKLDLNSVSLKQLEKHPYIGNY